MKKIISLILVITIILLVGCTDVENAKADRKTDYIQDSDRITILVDKETGVNYIVRNYFQNSTAITVRLNADGTPYISGVNGNE